MKFSEKLIRLRRINGITQDEFAKKVGVSRQAVYKWESGQSYPEVPKLLEIKNLFGISIDSLLDENFEIALPEKKKRKRSAKAEIISDMPAAEEEKVSAPEEKDADIKEEITAEKASIEAQIAEKEVPVVNNPESEVEKAEESKPEPTVIKEEKAEDLAKKKGFFGRLFGRR